MRTFRCCTVQKACLALCALFLITTVAYARADEKTPQPFDIEPQALSTALTAFARQSHEEILFAPAIVSGKRTAGVKGSMTPVVALKVLLKDTGLPFSSTPSGAILIGSANGSTAQTNSQTPSQSSDPATQEVGKKSSQDFRVAEMDQGSSAAVGAGGSLPSNNPTGPVNLEEVIVTAQKKQERLQDVPVPLTVLQPQQLAENGLNRLQDYFSSVPGLSFSDAGSGRQVFALRGVVSSAGADPTIAMTVDDVPVGSGSRLGLGEALPIDLDPSDLERIEVLRGPQGTLYGASSLGGLIKFVTKDPTTSGNSGQVQALGSSVSDGEFGYATRASANIALTDDLAVRVSGFSRRDPGYIDNVLTGQNDVNRTEAYGGRLALLWRISDAVTLKLSGLLQETHSDGTSTIDANIGATGVPYPTLGDLKQARLPGGEPFRDRIELYTAAVTARLAGVDFTSISSYGDTKYFDRVDGTGENGYLSEQFFQVAGENDVNYFETKKFTQELRLSQSGSTLEWLAGAFYTHEDTPADQSSEAVVPTTGTPVGTFVDYNFPTTLWEYALFGDLTYHLTPRFDVQLGARESWNHQIYNETDTGDLVQYYYGVNPLFNPTERIHNDAFTYLFTPRFKITPDLMLYARLASGYRLGGVNVNAVVNQTPVKYSPDKTLNYDLGLKGEALNHAISFDAAIYYIDWKDIQLFEVPGPFITNGGRAKSEGVEFSLEARPVQGLKLEANASLNNAVLVDNLPKSSIVVGASGDRLPYSSRISGRLAIEQDVRITDPWTAFGGGSVTYVGNRFGDLNYFFQTNARLYFPGYANTELHLGARDELWTINAFLNNVVNKRGITSGNVSYAESPYYLVYIQPRTVGLSITRVFH